MSTARFSIHGGPLYELAKARQQVMIDAAMHRRSFAVRSAARSDRAVPSIDYGAWLQLVADARGAR
jgi:dihydroneopterin aldolase